MFNSISLTGMAASIADAMGAQRPANAQAPIDEIAALVARSSVSGKAERVLVYNPDCVAFWLYQKYTREFLPVTQRAQLTLPMYTVFPPVTPVCFATMYTGAYPRTHGTEQYDKRVIEIDSLFDSLKRSGVRVAIVAVADSSMAKIFVGRDVDYYILPYDSECEQKAIELMESDAYDFICVYNQEYDDMIHDTTPESPESYKALLNHNAAFARLYDAAEASWAKYDTLVCYAPDHGVHLTINGVGDHFADIPADMNMIHFYGFIPAK